MQCDMSGYKPHYSKAVNWAVLGRNDERKQNKGCKGCRFVDSDYHCRYLLDMGPSHSRVKLGVKMRPGGGCDLYSSKKLDKTSTHPGILMTKGVAQKFREIQKMDPDRRISKLNNNPEAHKTALDLYNKGAGDAQIATALGVTKQTVFNWRKANGLSSNYHKFRKET